MARAPFLKRNDLAEGDRAAYDRIEKSRGGVGFIWQALLNAPNICDRILALADELRHGTKIDKRTRELGVLIVGQTTKCAYEFDHHWNAALKAGIPREHLEALADFETSPHFSEQDRAVMRFAKEVTQSGVVSDATWNALRKFYDTRQAMEIQLTIAWYNMVVRILLPLDIQNEPDFKRM
ncbi:MAG: carboxymuconolactone decarboxylase family protein [Xanthobacteraceae bacterium]